MIRKVALGYVVVSVLAIGLKVHRFKPRCGRWIFKSDKKAQLSSEKTKLSVTCVRFHVMLKKNTTTMKRDTSETKFTVIFCKISPASPLVVCQGTVVNESGMI
jgi:hypothetical protein